MAKFFVALLVVMTMSICSSLTPLDQLKAIVQSDTCTLDKVEALKPQIQKQVDRLKQNQNDLVAKAELIHLIQKVQAAADSCGLDKKIEPALGDVVEASGIAFLLLSNCSKDVGIVLLLADTIIQDAKDVVNDIVVVIFGALLGRQGYKDCSQFINFVIG